MEKVLIIGGGALGLLSARELSLAGLKVTLLDRQQPGQESSWAGGGIVSPLYPWRYPSSVTALAKWSQTHYPELVSGLIERTAIDPELNPCGMLIHAPGEVLDATTWADRWHAPLQALDQAAVHELEPARAETHDDTLWMPDVANIRNPRLLQALLADAELRGIDIHPATEVQQLVLQDDRVSGVRTADGILHADAILVCTGAWTGEFLQGLSTPPDIRPLRGQMLLFRTAPGTISRIMLEDNRYAIPRRDGRVLFGSSLEDAGFDKTPTDVVRAELLDLAIRRYPVLAEAEVEKHWAGLRPASPEGVPYIGRHPQLRNLFVNAGHFRNGIVLGPASARLVSDLMLGRPPILPPDPYALDAARG
jgi:glycine oxidase